MGGRRIGEDQGLGPGGRGEKDEDEDADEDADQENEEEVTEQKKEKEESGVEEGGGRLVVHRGVPRGTPWHGG